MPPHCDSLDGPVVVAARQALEKKNVELILPYVKKSGEGEIRKAYEKVMAARDLGGAAKVVVDLYFFETVVRIHREGEGADFTGLKPAGLDVGPVIPVAEKALESGSSVELEKILCDTIKEEVHHRLEEAMHLKQHTGESVDKAREYVEAMLGLQVWSHKLYNCAKSSAHEGPHEHG